MVREPARPARLIGRAAELEQLELAIKDARVGACPLVVISGEPGIGKTTLAHASAELAQQAGFDVAWARAWELGGAPPHWIWSQVLEALRQVVDGRTAGAIDDALTALQVRDPASPDEHRQFRVQDEIARTVLATAADRPIALIVDDLHAVEIESLRTLLLLVNKAQRQHLLVVATVRSVDARTTADQDDLLARVMRKARRIALAGLTRNELATMSSAVVDATHGMAFAEQLLLRTGGNPLFAHSLLQAMASGMDGTAIPRDVRAVIASRLETLDPRVMFILGAAAVIGMRSSLTRLQAVSAASADECHRAVSAAEAEELLTVRDGHLQFRHSLFAEGIEAQLQPVERATLHRRAAQLLENEPAPEQHLPEIARHYLAAATVDAEPRAREVAIAAARHAERSAAHAMAADLYARALAIDAGTSSEREAPADIELALAGAALLAGRRTQARDACRRAFASARARGDADGIARAAIQLASTAEYGVVDPEVVQALEVAVALEPRDRQLATRVRSRLAVALWASDAAHRREVLSLEAVALAKQCGSASALVDALTARSQAIWTPLSLTQRREMARELEQLTRTIDDARLRFEACRWWLNAAWEAGDGPDADAALDAYEAAGQRLGSPQARMNVALRRATRAQMRGAFANAESYIATLETEGRDAEDPQVDIYAEFGRLYPRLATGRLDEVRGSLARLYQGAEVWGAFPAPAHVPVIALLALGDAGGAARWVEAQERRPRGVLWGEPSRLAIVGELALHERDRERAEYVEASLAPFAEQYLWSGIGYPAGPAQLALARLDQLLGRAASYKRRLEAAREAARKIDDAPRAREVARRLDEASAASMSVPDVPTLDEGTLVRSDDGWVVSFRGQTTRTPALRGLDYVAALIRAAGAELHVHELTGTTTEAVSEGLGPRIDATARRAYAARIEQLRELIEEATARGQPARAERARAELEALEDEIAKASGLGGRAREDGSSAERARLAVAKAIRRARDILERQHPELARHLANSIRTGVFCSYQPEAGIRLTVSD